MNPLLQGLNPEQGRAVATLDGPLLILAGAGSGKTRVLTRRIAYLLESRPEVAPWNVLAVTFTNKAAGEMRERLHELVGESSKKLWLGTFHAVCLRILRQDIGVLGFTKDFAIWDDDDQIRVLKDILKDRSLGVDVKESKPSDFRSLIDRAKNELKGPNDIKALRGDPFPVVFRAYETRLKQGNALDFNDIVNRVVELWTQHPDILSRWRNRFHYVMVDEYQDTNPAQFRLLNLLVGDDGPQNLAVVGDDDQSIYSFRGADIRNILDFEKIYPKATLIKLEQNYRSTGSILKAASGVVQRNSDRKDKTLWTSEDLGEPLRLFSALDETGEAQRVVGEIKRLSRQYRPGDMAIIFRTNSQSRSFEQSLMSATIPYVLVGGRKFYERREVRDILSYLRLALNPADDMSFLRIVNVPARGIGDKSIEALKADAALSGVPLREAARRASHQKGRIGTAFSTLTLLLDRFETVLLTLPPATLIKYIAEESGYIKELKDEDNEEAQGRLENLEELARAAGDEPVEVNEPLNTLRNFVDRACLSGQADELPDDGKGKVTLLTAHLAKGLEFPVVFVVGLINGIFPHSRSETESAKEEERRLFYVALTRARERLYVSWPSRRRFPEGGFGEAEISPFVREIPLDAIASQDRGQLNRASSGVDFAAPFTPSQGFRPATRPTPSARPPSMPTRPAALPPRPPVPPARPATHASKPQGSLFSVHPSLTPPQENIFATRPSAPLPAAPQPTPQSRSLAMSNDDEDYRTMVPDSLEAFKIGLEVYHPVLGIGTIAKREGIPTNPRLTIHFRKHGPRTVFAIAASLEIVL